MVSVIFFIVLIGSSHAFWWSSPTSTESTPALKQIPVGYFRTYTYQPLNYAQRFPTYPSVAANPFIPDNSRPTWPHYNSRPVSLPPVRPSFMPSTTQSTTTTQQTSTPTSQYQPEEVQNYQASTTDGQQQSSFPSVPLIEIQPGIQAPSIPSYQLNSQPDLSGYQYFSAPMSQSVPQVQFVPCMCPVTISVGARGISEEGVPEGGDYLQRENVDSSSFLKD